MYYSVLLKFPARSAIEFRPVQPRCQFQGNFDYSALLATIPTLLVFCQIKDDDDDDDFLIVFQALGRYSDKQIKQMH